MVCRHIPNIPTAIHSKALHFPFAGARILYSQESVWPFHWCMQEVQDTPHISFHSIHSHHQTKEGRNYHLPCPHGLYYPPGQHEGGTPERALLLARDNLRQRKHKRSHQTSALFLRIIFQLLNLAVVIPIDKFRHVSGNFFPTFLAEKFMFPNVNGGFIGNAIFIDTVAIIISATIGRKENKSIH